MQRGASAQQQLRVPDVVAAAQCGVGRDEPGQTCRQRRHVAVGRRELTGVDGVGRGHAGRNVGHEHGGLGQTAEPEFGAVRRVVLHRDRRLGDELLDGPVDRAQRRGERSQTVLERCHARGELQDVIVGRAQLTEVDGIEPVCAVGDIGQRDRRHARIAERHLVAPVAVVHHAAAGAARQGGQGLESGRQRIQMGVDSRRELRDVVIDKCDLRRRLVIYVTQLTEVHGVAGFDAVGNVENSHRRLRRSAAERQRAPVSIAPTLC